MDRRIRVNGRLYEASTDRRRQLNERTYWAPRADIGLEALPNDKGPFLFSGDLPDGSKVQCLLGCDRYGSVEMWLECYRYDWKSRKETSASFMRDEGPLDSDDWNEYGGGILDEFDDLCRDAKRMESFNDASKTARKWGLQRSRYANDLVMRNGR